MLRAPVAGKARLILTINGTDYVVRRLDPDPAVAYVAWRLTKAGGAASDHYDVWEDNHGLHCTCPDFVWCREGKDRRGCKHCCGLRAVGLV